MHDRGLAGHSAMIVDPRIEEHLRRLQPVDDPVLEAMQREAEARGFPAVGPLVGRLLEVLARAVEARRVFELGSGFGYSTLWFARALPEDGVVVHTDTSTDLSEEARGWAAQAGLDRRVDFRVGDAIGLLEEDGGEWDLVFIDVDKGDYPRAWQVASRHVRLGGLVVMDNTLWQGRVADPEDHEAWTEAVREADRQVMEDPRFIATLLPLRDGVLVALRTG